MPTQTPPFLRRSTTSLALLVAGAMVLAACGTDDDDSNGPVTDAGDVGSDAADASDSGPDADVSVDTNVDADVDTGPPPIVRNIADTPWPPTSVQEPHTPAATDAQCSWQARVDACDHPLIASTTPPTDPTDPLFYVNRQNAVPAEYPFSPTSARTECDIHIDEGEPYTCIPDNFRTAPGRSLRTLAWDGDNMSGLDTTYDGLDVGHEGRVGFLPMIQAADAEGVELYIASAFRPFSTQNGLHEGYVLREIDNGYTEEEARIVVSTYSAVPGHSEHQLGITADLTYRREDGTIFPGLEEEMANDYPFEWVADNAHRFGIVLTYGQQRVAATQYVYEPWHYRYVGVEAADAMRSCDLNTEEFFAARYDVGIPLPEYAGERYILWDSAFVLRNITLRAGAWLQPGEAATKTWRIENDGTRNWWNYTIEQISGPDLGAQPFEIPCVTVGEIVDISIDIVAPADEGDVAAVFSLVDQDGEPVGDPLPIDLQVSTTPPPALPYTYVRVVDLSGATGGSDPGADIDAMILRTGDGDFPATSITGYRATPAAVVHGDPASMTGAPDAFYNYPDTDVCDVESGYASLGGGGFVVATFARDIVAGDTIAVLEVGGCTFDGGVAVEDELQVSVAPYPEFDADEWIVLGRGVGPELELVVPTLPEVRP